MKHKQIARQGRTFSRRVLFLEKERKMLFPWTLVEEGGKRENFTDFTVENSENEFF